MSIIGLSFLLGIIVVAIMIIRYPVPCFLFIMLVVLYVIFERIYKGGK